ncbi:MAG: transferase hexapeptide repeat containing protein [Verrucomicrobia bacterium]|nr:transferase hexapeptide repeat containing protein [Verrucomicrobiota bacterium]
MQSVTYRELNRKYREIEIGPYSYAPIEFFESLPFGTQIGSYCSIAAGVLFFRRNHPSGRVAQHPCFYNSALGVLASDSIPLDQENVLVVGDDVWIGANAIVTPRCRTLGTGCVVGAGSIVTKDVAPFAIVAGNPARQIGERFPIEVQKVLLESRWSKFPVEELLPFLPLFLENASVENAQRLRDHLSSKAQSR